MLDGYNLIRWRGGNHEGPLQSIGLIDFVRIVVIINVVHLQIHGPGVISIGTVIVVVAGRIGGRIGRGGVVRATDDVAATRGVLQPGAGRRRAWGRRLQL